jgi:hypothetical protein
LEEYQRVHHAQPPGEHDTAHHPQNADHGPNASPAGPTDHSRTAGHHAHGKHASGEARSVPPPDADAQAGPGDGAAEAPAQDAQESSAEPHDAHYQARFSGNELNLWTDGQGHWASEYKRADDALPIDHLADVRSRMGPDQLPVTEWVDGHSIDVTRDPKDGVWIPGLPGEVPDEAGDVLAGSDSPGEQRSRSRDLLSELTREAEPTFDEVNEVSDVSFKALHHSPEGKAEVPVPAHGPAVESTAHETPIGGMVTGVLAAGIGLWALRENIHEWRTRRKAGAGHASDG